MTPSVSSSSSSSSSSTSETPYRYDNNNRVGFHNTNVKLRSILMHPMGLLLTTLLNDVAPLPKRVGQNFWSVVNGDENDATFLTYQYGSKDRDCILAAAILKWCGTNETELTATIKLYMRALSNKGRMEGYGDNAENSLTFDGEKYVTNEATSGRMDFVISEKNDPKQKKPSIVAIVEVGVHHDKWWEKTDQVLQYVELIR